MIKSGRVFRINTIYTNSNNVALIMLDGDPTLYSYDIWLQKITDNYIGITRIGDHVEFSVSNRSSEIIEKSFVNKTVSEAVGLL